MFLANERMNSLKPPLAELPDLIDERPFVDVGNGIASYLIKSGNNIKKRATNERELLEISFDELGDRIGKPTAEMGRNETMRTDTTLSEMP